MTEQQITDEAIKFCSSIDFTDDKNLNEKGREKVKEWSKQDFIAGAKWMQEQLHLSDVNQRSGQLFCICDNPNLVETSIDNNVKYCSKCNSPVQNNYSMIKINKITSPTLDVYEPSGNLLGTVNEYEFLDIRVQIKKAQISGYYLMFKGKKIRIDRNGELEEYPLGLLDTMTGFYCELIFE